MASAIAAALVVIGTQTPATARGGHGDHGPVAAAACRQGTARGSPSSERSSTARSRPSSHSSSLAYYGWAIVTVWIGFGVWGLASAAIVRALAGSVLMAMASPLGRITPRLIRNTLRSMLAFGLGFQAVGLAALARNQGVNLVVVAAGGEQLLGFWSLANRLLQVPFWLFQALWRVSYPPWRGSGRSARTRAERSSGSHA